MENRLIGDIITENRIKRNYSQKDLADILSVARSTVANWEKNRFKPTSSMLKKIAYVLDIPLANLPEDDEINLVNNNIENKIIPQVQNKTTGEVIKISRKINKLKQSELANMLNVVPTTIASWESNNSSPSAANIKELSTILKVSPCEIVEVLPYDGNMSFYDVVNAYKKLNHEGRKKLRDSILDLTEIPKYVLKDES